MLVKQLPQPIYRVYVTHPRNVQIKEESKTAIAPHPSEYAALSGNIIVIQLRPN